MTAGEILALLAARHHRDVFVPSCKTGPTQNARGLRVFDAWAMPRSWSRPWTSGYEVKVARSDFRRDEKWDEYLEFCHLFYFVAPRGVIKVDELHQGIGLLEVASTGSRLLTIQKAAERTHTLPESIWRYVLMARVTVGERTPEESREARVDSWRRWLTQREERREIGYQCRGKMAELARRAHSENETLRAQIACYEEHRAQLRKVGLDPDDCWAWRLEERFRNIGAGKIPVPSAALDDIAKDAERIAKRIDALMVAASGANGKEPDDGREDDPKASRL